MVGQSNEGLQFNWNFSSAEQSQQVAPDHELKSDHVINTIKNIVHTIINDTTTPKTTTVVPAITQEIQTEMATGTTFVVNENTENSVLREVFQSNNTFMALNNTAVTKLGNSNSTVITAVDDVVNATSSGTDVLTTIADTVVTTTESIVTTVTNAVTSIMPSTVSPSTEYNTYALMEHEDYTEDKTLYIVLGVILGALIVVMIILMVIYKRYRSNFSQSSGAYCVTDLNEVRIAHADQKEYNSA